MNTWTCATCGAPLPDHSPSRWEHYDTHRKPEIECEGCGRPPADAPGEHLALYTVTWEIGDGPGEGEAPGTGTAILCDDCADNPADGVTVTPKRVA